MMEKVFEIVPRDEVFELHRHPVHADQHAVSSSIAMKLADRRRWTRRAHLLNMPDLFNYWLTGVANREATIASTTQFFNPAR